MKNNKITYKGEERKKNSLSGRAGLTGSESAVMSLENLFRGTQ